MTNTEQELQKKIFLQQAEIYRLSKEVEQLRAALTQYQHHNQTCAALGIQPIAALPSMYEPN